MVENRIAARRIIASPDVPLDRGFIRAVLVYATETLEKNGFALRLPLAFGAFEVETNVDLSLVATDQAARGKAIRQLGRDLAEKIGLEICDITPGSKRARALLARYRQDDFTPDNAPDVLTVVLEYDPGREAFDLRRLCLHNSRTIGTVQAYTGSDMPDSKAEMKKYVRVPKNWAPRRARDQERLLGEEMAKADVVAKRMFEANPQPTVLMMRGNSGAGKTYALQNSKDEAIRDLNVTEMGAKGDPEGLLNPDDIKYRLLHELENDKVSSNQTHSEGSMLTETIVDRMFADKKSFVLDKRFGLAHEVHGEVASRAKQLGYRIVMIDLDASIDTSCKRVYGRDIGGKAPNVPFKAVAAGFQEIRGDRAKIKDLAELEMIDDYLLFKSDGPKQGTLVAEKRAGKKWIIHDHALWKEATVASDVEILAAEAEWKQKLDEKANSKVPGK